MTTSTAPFRPISTGSQPAYDTPSYGSTRLRHPPAAAIAHPADGDRDDRPDASTPRGSRRSPICRWWTARRRVGERIIVRGRVIDEDGRPVPHTMIEIWQANASGRYDHPGDQHDAPLDPNFHGERPGVHRRGRLVSVHLDQAGRLSLAQPPQRLAAEPYPLLAVRPRLRPAAHHTDVFPGRPAAGARPGLSSRCRTQAARERLIAAFDIDITEPEWALGYRFDFVLRGRNATPIEARLTMPSRPPTRRSVRTGI